MPTLNQHLEGMQPPWPILKGPGLTMVVGRMYSFFYAAGLPVAASTPSPGLTGEALTAHESALPFSNAGAGLHNYLARFAGMGTVAGQWILCDRLWQNSGITITSTGSQTIDSVPFPARDANESANGASVLLGVEVSANTGAGVPTLTVGYTNSAGTGSKTATNLINTAATSVAGTFYPIGLQSGDSGMRSVQTYQQSATWTSGTIHLVAYREIARLTCPVANAPYSIDLVTGGQPKAWNNTVPFLLFVPGAATATTFNGQMIWSHA